jgi:hypothetical protein
MNRYSIFTDMLWLNIFSKPAPTAKPTRVVVSEKADARLARNCLGRYIQRQIAATLGGFLFRPGAKSVPRENGGNA